MCYLPCLLAADFSPIRILAEVLLVQNLLYSEILQTLGAHSLPSTLLGRKTTQLESGQDNSSHFTCDSLYESIGQNDFRTFGQTATENDQTVTQRLLASWGSGENTSKYSFDLNEQEAPVKITPCRRSFQTTTKQDPSYMC